jgi:hypothetical protein
MKKTLLLLLAVLLAPACNQQGTGSVDKGFRYTPGSMTSQKFNEPATSYDITFNGSRTGDYAVLTTQTISAISYTGIAVSDSPAAMSYDAPAETFSMKIFYRGDSITSGTTVGPMDPAGSVILADQCRIIINDNGSAYIFDGGDVSFTFTDNDDGTWSIVMTGSPTFNGGTPLSITTLTARKI